MPNATAETSVVATRVERRPCKECASLNLSIEKFVIEDDKAAEIRPSLDSLRLANERFRLGTLDSIKTRADDALLKAFESYLVLAAPLKYANSDLDYPKQLNRETQFLGRRFGATENKKNLIREFLRLCETNHDRRCTQKIGIENPFLETLMEPYFGVIDIENDRLVPLPFEETDERLQFEAYAAVSYVWGDTGEMDYRTKISNIQSRRKSGGLAATIRKLPKALAQSIRLVHDLGIRYVWIDALCIVQDSSHSWNLNSRAMHLVYGNATLTICAADGESQTGLLALDEDQRPKQQIGVYAEDVHLILHQPPEISIKTSKWNSRAWTFQERLLSKRCLIFTRGQIYFQCRSTGMSEDIFADGKGRGWSLDLVQAPLQMLTELKQRSMWFYAHCVYLYTLRELYEPLDILAAFSGMCKLMESTMQAPFAFGLPTSHFDLALLWEPVDLLTPLDYDRVSKEPKYKDIKFPSWSWCGWKSNGIQYKLQMVDGCLSDVHAWLLDHTWIDWHIRDGHGTLRRLWDRECAIRDQSTDEKWTGYNASVRQAGESSIPQANTSDDDSDTDSTPEEEGRTSKPPRRASEGSMNRQRKNSFGRKDLKRMRKFSRQILDGVANREAQDSYGRPLRGGPLDAIQYRKQLEFNLTLPEDPYHVRITASSQSAGDLKEFPDQPFLQFYTWRTSFHIVRSNESNVEGDDVGVTRARCHITDRRGDKCGSIVVNKDWLEKYEAIGQTTFEFIAISDAKSFSQQEFPVWTYYLPKERVDSEWDLYFVLLVEPFPDEGIHRRVALGKVFKAAFTLSDDEWKEIILG
ncbi:heterokaryon incompatibility protein-domain-containing protein [Alternaria rosae]|uniref:heterokaryon incompatibility protein-domain-containing protein n=1 Tax=Alternaria rosae TaxID=1187941 RepID=UPI001E8E65DE|nr:heterokaryon incompatibility protein-domain-containing protein [Alternaria rosae]KAH6857419.1 heterokaryon incompatibility protein-domain-containing protein [Alternaria rosae]